MKYEVTIHGVRRQVSVRTDREAGWLVAVDDGPERRVHGGPLGTAEWRLQTEGGATRVVGLSCSGEQAQLLIDGHPISAKVVDPRKDALALGSTGGAGAVITEMPGAIVRVLVEVGQAVAVGQATIVVEAMKMENELRAPMAGTIAAIVVAAGDRVESGALLIQIAAEGA